jgi:transcriptional regulator with XRE-family HTH domain
LPPQVMSDTHRYPDLMEDAHETGRRTTRRPWTHERGASASGRDVSRDRHHGQMAAIERAMAVATQRSRRLIVDVGRELRGARVSRGLSQAAVAAATKVEQAEVSRIERGLRPGVTIQSLARIAVAVGLEISIRTYPAGQPIRDRAHIAMLERFRRAVGPGWEWAAEVPLPIPGDKRAWDRVLRRAGLVIGVEGETRPTDMQELGRRLALKKRDGGMDRLVLVLADTAWCRQLIRLNDLEAAFPIPGIVALKRLASGTDPGGDTIILI